MKTLSIGRRQDRRVCSQSWNRRHPAATAGYYSACLLKKPHYSCCVKERACTHLLYHTWWSAASIVECISPDAAQRRSSPEDSHMGAQLCGSFERYLPVIYLRKRKKKKHSEDIVALHQQRPIVKKSDLIYFFSLAPLHSSPPPQKSWHFSTRWSRLLQHRCPFCACADVTGWLIIRLAPLSRARVRACACVCITLFKPPFITDVADVPGYSRRLICFGPPLPLTHRSLI